MILVPEGFTSPPCSFEVGLAGWDSCDRVASDPCRCSSGLGCWESRKVVRIFLRNFRFSHKRRAGAEQASGATTTGTAIVTSCMSSATALRCADLDQPGGKSDVSVPSGRRFLPETLEL